MKKEFNLSEKITSNMKENSWTSEGEPTSFKSIPSIFTSDVEEFIKRRNKILEDMRKTTWDEDEEHSSNPIHQSDFIAMQRELDKLAGDKLKNDD